MAQLNPTSPVEQFKLRLTKQRGFRGTAFSIMLRRIAIQPVPNNTQLNLNIKTYPNSPLDRPL